MNICSEPGQRVEERKNNPLGVEWDFAAEGSTGSPRHRAASWTSSA